MDIKDVLPIVGVIIGWLLKEISDYFKQRSKERKEVGTALTGLLELHDELRRLKTHLEDYKDRAKSWEDYESFRVRTAKRYMTRTDPAETIQAALEVLSSNRPLQATNLQNVTMLIDYFGKFNLHEFTKDEESYIRFLSTFEVIFDISEKILKKLIRNLAWVHGAITYLRVRLMWRRYRKGKESKTYEEMRKKMFNEIYSVKNVRKE